jgi:ABC-type uncharacterized transport system permease subunit
VKLPMRIAPILIIVVLAAGGAAGYAYWQQQATRVPPGLARANLAIPVFVIMILLSGTFTPFESMPVLLQDMMYLAPSTHFVKFAQSVLYRGAGIDVVWRDLAIMAGLGGIFLAIALARFRTMLARQA